MRVVKLSNGEKDIAEYGPMRNEAEGQKFGGLRVTDAARDAGAGA